MALEVDWFLRAHPGVTMIEALLPDSNGVLRGKWLPRSKLAKVFKGELKFPKTALSLDIWGRDVEELVFATGDEDGVCLPIEGSLLPTPWSPRGRHGQLMLTMFRANGDPYLGDPRQVLKRVVSRYHAQGWRPVVAAELEFSLLRWDGRRPDFSERNGYRGEPIPGVPFHEAWGIIPNEAGRVVEMESREPVDRLYVVGWAKRGPTGLIGTNSKDSHATVAAMLEDIDGASAPMRSTDAGIVDLLTSRGVDYVTYADWERLDQDEITRGEAVGKIREKYTTVADMMAAIHRLR